MGGGCIEYAYELVLGINGMHTSPTSSSTQWHCVKMHTRMHNMYASHDVLASSMYDVYIVN